MFQRLALLALIALVAVPLACTRSVVGARASSAAVPAVQREPAPSSSATPELARASGPSAPSVMACDGCDNAALNPSEVATLEKRIAELRQRGEPCSTYADVMDRSVRSGQISMRPYMWRVGAQLASGQARPDGAMVFAREIDSLNLGMRPFDKIVWTIEHEAAHIAFGLDSPLDRVPGDRADAYVKACRS
ncbi:MAG: hypothetical protein ABI910_20420 [Gemmatimonadota bacterium]